jgi:hypothetical protein
MLLYSLAGGLAIRSKHGADRIVDAAVPEGLVYATERIRTLEAANPQ